MKGAAACSRTKEGVGRGFPSIDRGAAVRWRPKTGRPPRVQRGATSTATPDTTSDGLGRVRVQTVGLLEQLNAKASPLQQSFPPYFILRTVCLDVQAFRKKISSLSFLQSELCEMRRGALSAVHLPSVSAIR